MVNDKRNSGVGINVYKKVIENLAYRKITFKKNSPVCRTNDKVTEEDASIVWENQRRIHDWATGTSFGSREDFPL